MKTKEEKIKFYKEHRTEIDKKISNSRTKIMVDTQTVFMSDIILSAPMEMSPDLEMPTMGTDGLKIVYDPEFVVGLDYKELIFVICHEGAHNFFFHTDPTRHKMVVDNNDEFNHMIFNIAGDIIINSFLTVSRIGKCPEQAIKSDNYGKVKITLNKKDFEFEEAFKLSLDAVYRKLISEVPRIPLNSKGGSGDGKSKKLEKGQTPTGDDDINGERLEVSQDGKNKTVIDYINKASPEQVKEIESAVRQQWVKNKQQGIGSKWLNDMLDDMLKPIVNWKNELRAFVIPEIVTYESYATRDRRRAVFEDSHGLIFPGAQKEGVEVIVNFDTSGSISKKELDYFVGELNHMFKSFPKDVLKVKVMLSTDQVYYFEDIKDIKDAKKLKIQSGGTCHLEVFEKASRDKIQALICFTDSYTTYPKIKPKGIKKVLVISTTKEKAPKHIGRTIHVDLNKLNI